MLFLQLCVQGNVWFVWYSTGEKLLTEGLFNTLLPGPSALIIPQRPHLLCLPHSDLFWKADYSRRENKTKPLPSWQIRCILGRGITSVSPPWTSSEPGKWLRCLHGASTVQAIRRTEYRPAIDKPNSLVPHSLPSKLPLDMSGSHRTQWKPRSIHFLSSRSWHTMKFYFEGVNCLRSQKRWRDRICATALFPL